MYMFFIFVYIYVFNNYKFIYRILLKKIKINIFDIDFFNNLLLNLLIYI